jgi:hypothetical protein
MAAVAVQTLLAEAEGGGSIGRRVELATDRIVRESTAPPGAATPVVSEPFLGLEPLR